MLEEQQSLQPVQFPRPQSNKLYALQAVSLTLITKQQVNGLGRESLDPSISGSELSSTLSLCLPGMLFASTVQNHVLS